MTPEWDDEQDGWDAPSPLEWMHEHYPNVETEPFITEDDDFGFELDGGDVVMRLYLKERYLEIEEGDITRTMHIGQMLPSDLDDNGDWRWLKEPLNACIVHECRANECTTSYIIRDGRIIRDVISHDGTLVRSLMSAEGIRTWPPRKFANHLEVSDTAVVHSFDRLATRPNAHTPWKWFVDEDLQEDITQMAYDEFGVNLDEF